LSTPPPPPPAAQKNGINTNILSHILLSARVFSVDALLGGSKKAASLPSDPIPINAAISHYFLWLDALISFRDIKLLCLSHTPSFFLCPLDLYATD
jgi:hypothetical protein